MALHFAYGSNLDRNQMKCRCPEAELICITKKIDYHLVFTRCSKRQKGGVASIEKAEDDCVWGALYELTPTDIERLDKCEGVPKAYSKEYNFEVVQPEGSTVQTYTYIANKCGSFKPHRDYLYKIIKGAQKWGLPPAYIEKLKQIPYKEDS